MLMRMADLYGGNLNIKSFMAPIRTEAIPIPIKILPKIAAVNDSPKAKRNEPNAPINGKEVMTKRGPIRSSIGPIGI